MGYTGKKLRWSKHALDYRSERGFSESEVELAIRSASWVVGARAKLECRMDLPFGKEWNGKTYQTKQVRPIFVDDPDAVVIITVYTYYF